MISSLSLNSLLSFSARSIAKVVNTEIELPEGFVEFKSGLSGGQLFEESKLGRAEKSFDEEILIKRLFSKDNILRLRSEVFVGCVPGKTRLAGFIHKDQEIGGQRVAFFGFWDGIDDLSSHKEIFKRFENWCLQRKVTKIYGPINFSTFFNYRLKLDGFDVRPFSGEPTNPVYYPDILQKLGYSVEENYISSVCNQIDLVKREIKEKVSPYLGNIRQEYEVVSINRSDWEENVQDLCNLANEIFAENFAFRKFNSRFFKSFFGEKFFSSICLSTSLLLKEKSSRRIVGFGINLKDDERLLIKTVGVDKDHRKKGLNFLFLVEQMLLRSQTHESLVMCLMKEGNFPSLLSRSIVDKTVNYGLFSKSLLRN